MKYLHFGVCSLCSFGVAFSKDTAQEQSDEWFPGWALFFYCWRVFMVIGKAERNDYL